MNERIIIYPTTIVYIVVPANIKTGGPELLHQLFVCLKEKAIKVMLVNYDVGNGINTHPYFIKKYSIDSQSTTLNNVIDSKKNVIIYPETMTTWGLKQFTKIRKCIFWLSLDLYLDGVTFHNFWYINVYYNKMPLISLLRLAKQIIFKQFGNTLSVKEMKEINYHISQSYYVYNYLKRKRFKNYFYLGDYLSEDFHFSNKPFKENIICYNPKKGIIFTNKIINYCREYTFIPIINMSNHEVAELLSKSKLYIDFGFHPGKDRLPREAVLCGCCVLTSKRGAAKNKQDIPINKRYKIKDNCFHLKKIKKRINEIMINYEDNYNNFLPFAKQILQEKKMFEQNADFIFNIIER